MLLIWQIAKNEKHTGHAKAATGANNMNEEVFTNLVKEHQKILHKICWMYRDSPEDREDLFQEITFQLWKAFPSFKNEAKISTWIYRIALNTAIASFRKKRPDIEYAAVLPDMPGESEDEGPAIRLERLHAVVKQLNEGEKAIITLYFEELSYQQIAAITGLSENNVGVKLNRIKNKIQKLLPK